MTTEVFGMSTAVLSHVWSTTTDVIGAHDFTERADALDTFLTDSFTHVDPLSGVDPSFVFDFRAYDDLDDGQRWSTWLSVEPLCRGPEPRPDWVVTSQGAIDTELGILKTGKEADVFLLERADPLDAGRRRRDGRQALPRAGAPHLPPRPRPTPRAAR